MTENKLVNFIISEKAVITVIVINAVAMFLDAFPSCSSAACGVFAWLVFSNCCASCPTGRRYGSASSGR